MPPSSEWWALWPASADGAAIVFSAALVTAVATGLGALPFAFITRIGPHTMATTHALAAGLMLGASFGLLTEGAAAGLWQTLGGGAAGITFILATQRVMAGRDPVFGALSGAGARRMLLIVVVMTVHSFAEGVAVGVSFGGGSPLAAAITIAIAIHNIPEGLAITAVLRPRGVGLLACAGWSIFSSLPQPLMAVPAYLFVERFSRALPFGLGFAAGAMIYLVLVELLPEAYDADVAPGAVPTQPPMGGVAETATLSLIAMLAFQRALST